MKPILVIMAFTFVISFIQVSNAEPTLNECLGIGSTAKPTDEDIRACKTAGEAHWLYPQDRAKSYVMLARLFFMRRDFNRAKAAAVSALQQDRRNILAHYFIAHASYILGNYRDAEASSKDAIDLWPKYARAYFVRAWSLLALARYQEAIGDGLKLIKIEPKNGAAYSLVSLGLIAVGQNESSQKYAAKAIELAPKLAQGHMYLAAAQALSGQDDLAQVSIKKKDGSNGLFTKYLLIGLSGEADVKPYGDGNGTVDWQEMASYLQDTLTYMSRRYYGRDQVAQFRISKN